ncbi:MAG: hypothetical protein Q8M72_02715 [Methylocystis sp.]|nr:hypothetical protein [Methylocystis sp.]
MVAQPRRGKARIGAADDDALAAAAEFVGDGDHPAALADLAGDRDVIGGMVEIQRFDRLLAKLEGEVLGRERRDGGRGEVRHHHAARHARRRQRVAAEISGKIACRIDEINRNGHARPSCASNRTLIELGNTDKDLPSFQSE